MSIRGGNIPDPAMSRVVDIPSNFVIFHVMILLLLAALSPVRILPLGQKFDRIELYDHRVYLTQRYAKSIAFYPDSGSPENIPITDEENFRIAGFQITPFVFYLNTGTALVRFFPVSGVSDTLYLSGDISSFVVTRDGDAAVGDRQLSALVYLDHLGQTQFLIREVAVKDLRCRRDTLYALAGKKLLVYDKFGNPIRAIDAPENLDRLFVTDSTIFLFTAGQSCFYIFDGQWTKIELPFELNDLAADDSNVVILGDHGSNLYYFLPTERRIP
jgi:hypothetical protein